MARSADGNLRREMHMPGCQGDAGQRGAWRWAEHQDCPTGRRALSYYAMAKDAHLSDTQVAWKARAALRSGDWKVVLAAIQALSPEEARDPTWRYWRARALRQLGEAEASTALLTTVKLCPPRVGGQAISIKQHQLAG